MHCTGLNNPATDDSTHISMEPQNGDSQCHGGVYMISTMAARQLSSTFVIRPLSSVTQFFMRLSLQSTKSITIYLKSYKRNTRAVLTSNDTDPKAVPTPMQQHTYTFFKYKP